jgi:hypothetical protein
MKSDDHPPLRVLPVALDPSVLAARNQNSGSDFRCVHTLEQARTCLQRDRFAVVLSQLRLADGSGTSLIDLVVKQHGWLFLRTTVLGQTAWLPAVQEGTDSWGTRDHLASAEFAQVFLQLIEAGGQPSSTHERLGARWHDALRRLLSAFARSAEGLRTWGRSIGREDRSVAGSTLEHVPITNESKAVTRLVPRHVDDSSCGVEGHQRIA